MHCFPLGKAFFLFPGSSRDDLAKQLVFPWGMVWGVPALLGAAVPEGWSLPGLPLARGAQMNVGLWAGSPTAKAEPRDAPSGMESETGIWGIVY